MVQRLYVLFSASSFLKDNVKGPTLKPLSQTRWESRVESGKVIRYQVPQIRDALIHLASSNEEP